MKRLLFILSLIVNCQLSIVNSAAAQSRFGYLSCDSVLHLMPEFVQAQQSVADLRAKYDREAARGEQEFQKKFSEFLQGQKDFPENILVKRQAELQTLMDSGISFRREARQLLTKAHRQLLATAEARLNEAIQAVAQQRDFDYVLNTDRNQFPYVNPLRGEDITEAVLIQLGLREKPVEGE